MEADVSSSNLRFGAPLQVEMVTPVSSSLGTLSSLLRKLVLLLAPEYKMHKGVKDEMKLLKEDLDKSNNLLLKLSAVENPNRTAKYWMKEVRELSYDIEDYFDNLVCPDPSYANTKSLSKHSRPKKVQRSISKLRARVQETINLYERCQIRDCSSFTPMYLPVGPQIPTVYTETEVPGLLDDPFNKLSKFLADSGRQQEQQLNVFSILGSGGLGKTSLARRLYQNPTGEFQCKAFVRVSQKPDMARLLWSMLGQIQPSLSRSRDTRQVQDLLENIREHLQDKRYLIIIDDIVSVQVWDVLRHAFPGDSNHGSRIITTTQIEPVALACCSYHTEYIFKMEPLNDSNSRKLFFSRVFGSEDDCPEQLKQVSYKIIKKCGGLPLATINLASFIASQPIMLMEQWMHIESSFGSIGRTNPNSEEMGQVLNLIYTKLPEYLKTCFLYLIIYPEDYTVTKDDLVKQWVAEGFVNAVEGQDMYETARSYFDELVNRRLIQPTKISYEEVLSCSLHDFVIDFLAQRAMEENFITLIDYSRTNIRLPDKVRRLSLKFDSEQYVSPLAGLRLSQVRSLAFFGLCKCIPYIQEFNLLRVLILEIWGDLNDTILDFTGISILLQLRYLKILSNIMVELPAKMQGLQYMETLEIDARRATLPSDIVNLPVLSHLCLPAGTNFPDGIGNLSSLLTLKYFDLNDISEEHLQSLVKLTNLQDLGLNCSSMPSIHLKRNLEALGPLLEQFGKLKSLSLVTGSSGENIASFVCDGWSNVKSPLLIEKLELAPRLCIFSRLPDWITYLEKLHTLKITVRELLQTDIDNLARLAALTILSLNVRVAPAERIVLYSMAFPVLKYMKFRCSTPCLTFQAGALPKLGQLKLGFGANSAEQHQHQHQHRPAYEGIENLLSLQQVTGLIDGSGSNEAAELALNEAIRLHPNRPNINIHLVVSIFHGEQSGTWTAQENDSNEQHEAQENDSNEQPQSGENDSIGQLGVQQLNEQHAIEVKESNEQHEIQEEQSNQQYDIQQKVSNQPREGQEKESNEHHEIQEKESDEQHKIREKESNEQHDTPDNASKEHHRVQALHIDEDKNKQPDNCSHTLDPLEISSSYIQNSDIMVATAVTEMPTNIPLSSQNFNLDFSLRLSANNSFGSEDKSSLFVDFYATWLWRLRNYLMLIGIVVVGMTYNAGLVTPGGFWKKNTNGHDAGDSVLRVRSFRRYLVFFYCNTSAFFGSIILIILLQYKNAARNKHSMYRIIFALTVDLFSLMGAYVAGTDTALSSVIYIGVLCSAVSIYAIISIILFVPVTRNWLNHSRKVVLDSLDHMLAVIFQGKQTRSHQNIDVTEVRKFGLVLATCSAALTYQAGLSPPGGFWAENDQNHRPATSSLYSNSVLRYKVFYYCNSTTFLASLFAVILLLNPHLKKDCNILKTVIVLIHFGLIGAYAAGCCSGTVGSFYGKSLLFGISLMFTVIVSILCYKPGTLKWMDIGRLVFPSKFGSKRAYDVGQAELHATGEPTVSNDNVGNPFERGLDPYMRKSCKYIILLGILGASQTYQSGLNPPGGFWLRSEDNHSPGDLILKDTNHARFLALFYLNTTAFVFSVLVITFLMVNPYFAKPSVLSVLVILPLTWSFITGSSGEIMKLLWIWLGIILSAVLVVANAIREKWRLNWNLKRSSYLGKANDQLETNQSINVSSDARGRNSLFILAILAATVTYQAGMNIPGGVWSDGKDVSGKPGNPILQDSNPHRYKVFFYSNSLSFGSSVLITVMLLTKGSYEHGLKYRVRQLWSMLGLLAIMSAYVAGSTRKLRETLYTILLTVLVLVFLAINGLSFLCLTRAKQRAPCDDTGEAHFVRDDTVEEHSEMTKHKYLMLVVTLTTFITYRAGLNPPGGFWYGDEGHSAGIPVLAEISPRRYKIFFCSNTISFMASCAVMVLLLIKYVQAKYVQLKLLNWIVILDLLALFTAFAAGSYQQISTTVYVLVLEASVVLGLGLVIIILKTDAS